MRKLTLTLLLITTFSFWNSYGQEHPHDKKFNEYYQDSRDNGSNGALSYELLSESFIDDWDAELNRVYKELMSKLPEYKKSQLKEAQRKWIEFRDLNFKLLNDIDKDVMYPQPKSRELKFIRQRVLELIDISQRYNNTDIKNELENFNLSNSSTLSEIKKELEECYLYANKMFGLTGENLNIVISKGDMHYNKAYNLFLTLQKEADYKLPKGKSKVISKSLKTYAEIFNNKYSVAQNFKPDIDFIKENLEKFPTEITQIEKDNEENIIRLILGSRSKRQIILPKNGNWCLWEIIGDDRIWMEGYVPNNGFAKFDVPSNQLPMYLGTEKEFIISSNLKNIQLIFKECEKE